MTDMGEEQEIACIVSSSPVAEVTWMKDGASLDAGAGPDTVLSHTANRHSLLIMAVSQQSVGQYSCTANNSLGEATATADISGDAHPAIVLSNHLSDDPHKFALEWSSESKSDIELFEIAVRKGGEETWKLYEVNMKVETNKTNTNETEEFVSDYDIGGDYRGELVLTDLEADTTYEVTVASRNKFGLSSHGDLFTFQTKAEGIALFKEMPFPTLNISDPTTVTEPEPVTDPVTEAVTEPAQATVTKENADPVTDEDTAEKQTSSSTELEPFIHMLCFLSLSAKVLT